MLIVLIAAILIGLILQANMFPNIVTESAPVLGDMTYDFIPIASPVANGGTLQFLTWLLTESPLSTTLLRYLLFNKNGFWKLRSLGSQMKSVEPLYYPMMQLSQSEFEKRGNVDKSMDFDLTMSENINKNKLYTDFMEATSEGDDFQMRFPRRTIRYYHTQYIQGSALPSEIVSKTVQQALDWESDHNLKIFTAIDSEKVMQQALESDARYKAGKPLSMLDGVPIGIKDNLPIKDHILYQGGSPKTEHRKYWQHIKQDDILVARLRAAGAIILGQTVMIEGGVTPLGWSSHWQGPLNVYNPDRYPGGSSSGSAVAVAAGLMPATIGGDGGGSIRIPASMMGVHGLGASYGRIPVDYGTASTVLKFGPLASTTEDAAIVYALTAPNVKGHYFNQIYDGNINGPPAPSLDTFNDIEDLSDVRIGIWREWFDDSEPAVKAACYEAIGELQKKGATLVDIAIPNMNIIGLAHASKISVEFASKWDYQMHDMPDSMEANTKITIAIGKTMTALDTMAGEKLKRYIYDHVENLFEEKQLTTIAIPTIPSLPPVLTKASKVIGENNNPVVIRVMKNCILGNFIGIPGYSVNVGYEQPDPNEEGASDPVPIGLHFYAQHWKEHHLFRMAHAVEKAVEHKFMKPPLFFDPFADKKGA